MNIEEKIKRVVGVTLCGISVMVNTIAISVPAIGAAKQKTAISCRPARTDMPYDTKPANNSSPFTKNDQGGCAHPCIAAFACALVRLKCLYAQRNSCVH